MATKHTNTQSGPYKDRLHSVTTTEETKRQKQCSEGSGPEIVVV